MKNVIIRKITLNHTFFKDADIIDLYTLPKSSEANLKLIPLSKENIEDKETARTLKLLFDKRSNIHDSNNLFPIEQEFYIEELTSNSKPPSPHKWENLFALYLNKWVSNFGTSWLRVLIWIIFFSLLVLFFHDGIPHNIEDFTNIPNRTMELINPLNVFKKDYMLYDGHEFWGMIVRIVTIYLFYQFAMAFRQNTRRK